MTNSSVGNLRRMLPIVALASFCGAAIAAQPPKEISAEDYVKITQLYAKFNFYLNTGQAEKYADLFTDDGEFTGGRPKGSKEPLPRKPEYVGRQQLTLMARRAGTTTSRHYNANLVVEPTADGATAHTYMILVDTSTSTIPFTAIYDDTLVKLKDGTWKFKKRINWRDVDDLSPYKPKPADPSLGLPGTNASTAQGAPPDEPAPAARPPPPGPR